ncbi:uncharacterized protein LOC104583757 isoform X2 [Brachypodium distachyon]|uniref:uncharacterized protein LOC104583757 isoform X2 n=1 Tax=Brachypodium distachyon TaxID=15368 RepID=UPI000D0E2A24|nr:uncharacterized protein LOC104583757 isoform X2 [Brachypodium distachyon]|eukprot:XP_024318414.1 uncharacterized protein LOC104583757 isoform X2 [Brachypodium distachyon]
MPRPFRSEILGLLRRGEDEFAMAQLQVPGRELCVLRSRLSNHDHDHKWEVSQNVQIQCGEDESSDLFYWATDAVIPFGKYLCWVDYSKGGIVFCDMFEVFEEMPKISYLRLPIEDRPPRSFRRPFLDRKRSVCVAEGVLKFMNVSRDDGELLGPMEPGTGFTITSHVLKISERGNMEWHMDFSIRSVDLWACNIPERLPRCALMYPVVSMDRPHLLHFLLSEYDENWIEKVSRVTIDISTNAVVSVLPYIGQEDQSEEDADMVELRSRFLQSFLPSEFPKFLNGTRKRKNQV